MKIVHQSERWLAWFIREAQCPDAERYMGASVVETLQTFAKTLEPDLVVEWDADVGGPSPGGPLVMGKLGSTQPRSPIPMGCFRCGSKVTWRKSQGQGVCGAHEAEERAKEARDQAGAELAAEMFANRPASPAPAAVAEGPPAPTDCAALFREILEGLDSYLKRNSEWTFPTLRLTPTVEWSAKQSLPSRYIMAPLRDAVLWGISDLLLKHGHKIQTCAAEGCGRSLLSIRRQTYCSPRCSIQVRHARYRNSLNKDDPDGFKKQRHKDYLRRVEKRKEKERQKQERAQSELKTKNKGVTA